MLTARFTLVGTTPIAFGAPIRAMKKATEKADAFEERTWKERMHTTQDGEVILPCNALKNCLTSAAAYLSERIPGAGQKTYTKKFTSGVSVLDDIRFGVQAEEVEGDWRFVPSDGKTGGTKRVWKCFPVVDEGWRSDATVYVMDKTITPDVLERHLRQAGSFIGLGVGRPERNGWFGRFEIDDLTFEDDDED